VTSLKITYKDPARLKPRARNPRTHTAKQIRQIQASIEEFGFINPVLIDGTNGIIAGHGRLEAAKLVGIQDVPTVRVDHLTPAQIRAYVIADNKLAENAGWDRELLTLELQELSVELNFDVTITGFETAEIDLLIGPIGEDASEEDNELPAIDRTAPAVTRPGDSWRIGDHYLFCGDALKADSYNKLLGSQKAQLVFTDPPYNVAIEGNVSGLGRNKHREFAMASGEMSVAEFTQFLETTFKLLTASSANGSIHYICMDRRHMREVLEAAETPYSELKNLCVWSKSNAGMGSLYRSQHELVFVFKNGTKPHINNVELGRFGRNRTNVWNYAGASSFGSNRDAELSMHPTVKPLSMVADAILDCSKRGGIVLDAFAGSGTTLIAAERTGRRGYGVELDPYYCDTIVRRFEDAHDLKAVHVETGLEFDKLKTQRLASGKKRHEQKGKTRAGKTNKKPGAKGRSR
jgi:DNA modification methylase